MDFALTESQEVIKKEVGALARTFSLDYWLEKDDRAEYPSDFVKAFAHYQRSRVARTARVVLSAREMGRIFHAKGVERLVRNDLWKGRSPERYYDAMEWLYGWTADNCLAA